MADVAVARKRLVFDELLRMQLALVLRKRPSSARVEGHRPPTWPGPSSALPRAAPVPLTGAQRRVDRRDRGRPRRPTPDAPPAAGRRRRGQDGGGRGGPARRGRGRPPGGADGAHRGAGRAAPRSASAPARGPRGTRSGHDRCSGSGRCGSSCSPTGSPRPTARVLADLEPGRSTSWSAPTPSSRTVSRSGPSAWWSSTSSTASASSSGPPCGTRARRRRPRRAGHDGHADPAHRGHDRLRRPRRVGARRAAARAHADRVRSPWVRARRDEAEVWARCGRGGRRAPGLRGVPADRGVREARGPLGRGDLRPPHRRRAGRAPGRAAPRPAARRRRRRHHAPRSARASSTCWWPPPSSRSASTSPTPP
jgi:hypothetical protein